MPAGYVGMGKLVVIGAGAIGTIQGLRARQAGHAVTFLVRPGRAEALRQTGLQVLSWPDPDQPVVLLTPGGDEVEVTEVPACVADADAVGVAVPSNGTNAVGVSLSEHLRPQTPVISWQNGVDNARWLRGHLPDNPVLGSIVLYNAVRLREGTVRYTIPNAVVYEAAARSALLTGLDSDHSSVRQPVQFVSDLLAVQWSKLLVNLANGPLALVPLGYREAFADRDFRTCARLTLTEGLNTVRAAGIEPSSLGDIDPRKILLFLRLPAFLVPLLRPLLPPIHEDASPSTAQMLARGVPTEIDHLNGRIVDLAEHSGGTAPVNSRILELVKAEEDKPLDERRRWTAAALRGELEPAKES
jgi:2-dehydropantoate 2-reductase